MEGNVDSLILNVLRSSSIGQTEAAQAGERFLAAVCNTNEPDSLPCAVFRPRADKTVQFGQRGQARVRAF